MKKFAAGLLALCLLLTLSAGCGLKNDEENTKSLLAELAQIDGADSVLDMNGNSIPADIYLYWLANTCNNLQYQLTIYSMYYGMYGETLDDDGNVLWDQSVEGTPLVDMAREEAENSALSYALMENVAKDHGVAFSDEDQAALDEAIAQQIEDAGGEDAFLQGLYEQGLSLKSYKRMISDSYLYQHLVELASDPDSSLYQAPSDDNAYVDHILLMTTNAETGEPLPEEDVKAKREQAQDLLNQLQSSNDLESQFTEFANTYGEDPSRAENTGYLINPDTNFVQEFKDAAFALSPGEISGIVESDYGYHILLRKNLTEDQIASLAESSLQSYLDEQMEIALENVQRSDALDGIDVGALYNGYVEKLQELHPEETEDNSNNDANSDANNDANSDEANDGDNTSADADDNSPEPADGSAE